MVLTGVHGRRILGGLINHPLSTFEYSTCEIFILKLSTWNTDFFFTCRVKILDIGEDMHISFCLWIIFTNWTIHPFGCLVVSQLGSLGEPMCPHWLPRCTTCRSHPPWGGEPQPSVCSYMWDNWLSTFCRASYSFSTKPLPLDYLTWAIHSWVFSNSSLEFS